MKKILVLSDTHKKHGLYLPVVEALIKDIDCIIHLGDSLEDVEVLKASFPDMQIEYIAGNSENDHNHNIKYEKVLIIEGKKLFITHGHLYGVKQSDSKIISHALNIGADVLLFGHTHVPLQKEVDGMLVLNPGAWSFIFAKSPSYGLVEINEGKIKAEICYLR